MARPLSVGAPWGASRAVLEVAVRVDTRTRKTEIAIAGEAMTKGRLIRKT